MAHGAVTRPLPNEGERACGGLIELGAAIAGGAQCFIVSPDWWSVAHHPRCRTFLSLEAAITAIVDCCWLVRSIGEGRVN